MSRVRVLLFAALVTLLPAHAHAVGLTRVEIVQQSVKTPGASYVTGFGVRTHLKGGDLNDGFALVPAIEYWQKVVRLEELGVNEVRQSDWRIGGDLRYRFGDAGGWAPYGGAGLALDIVHSEADIQPVGSPRETREESGRKLAPNFLIGVDTPSAGPIRSSIEFNWHLVPDLHQFKINFGIGYEFGGGGAEKPAESSQ
jgi:hypothetical protein